jgi:site-specific DNA-methyltransferase (adenine-specific)
VHGDNLEALGRMESGSVALIYIDPPFNTGRRQTRLRMKTVIFESKGNGQTL